MYALVLVIPGSEMLLLSYPVARYVSCPTWSRAVGCFSYVTCSERRFLFFSGE